MGEMLERCDVDGRPLGPVARERAHGDPTIIHLTVHLHVFHPDGRLLLQKRSAHKDLYPGVWDTAVGGHVGAGENVLAALRREAGEELGIEAGDAIPLYRYLHANTHESEYVHTWRLVCGGPFHTPPQEIEAVRFHTAGEIEAHLGDGTFTPNFEAEYRRLMAAGQGAGP